MPPEFALSAEEEEAHGRVRVWSEIVTTIDVAVFTGGGRLIVVLEIITYVFEFVDVTVQGMVVIVPDIVTVVTVMV